MSIAATVRASQKPIQEYYQNLKAYSAQGVAHESAVRTAFQTLLADTAKACRWTLIPELSMRVRGKTIRPDGTLRDDEWKLHRGYWEAKDAFDDLDDEIRKKADQGYPLLNTIFEDSRKGVLYQNGKENYRANLADPHDLANLLSLFYGHTEGDYERFEEAVAEFRDRIPQLATRLLEMIGDAHETNSNFEAAFGCLFELCRESLNPNISKAAVDEMLIQHLLTERVFDGIFQDQDFIRRNAIAAEIEKVVLALVSQSFNRHEFLRPLDPLYKTIELAAANVEDFGQKQQFLNTVYERFFQGYSVRTADTHGIVYTPQEVVDFMCASVGEVLHAEFGKTFGDDGVQILDPCTGTGNFIVNVLRRIAKPKLTRAYRSQLFANEVMLLPYYIAAMNIEHEYYEAAGRYEPFPGMCFVDTLELDGRQGALPIMAEENTARVRREKQAAITIIVGNPPYNVGQLNENDNNKNRRYPAVEQRVRDTYSKGSSASNKNALSDAYVKFFRWSIDRLGDRPGIVCFVTNNGFIDGIAFDGFRKHLLKDFDTIYHLDLKGNARTTGERRRQEGGNIFNNTVRVGVGVTLLVRPPARREKRVYYAAVDDYLGTAEKERFLAAFDRVSAIAWKKLDPDSRGTWLVADAADEFASLIPIGCKRAKAARTVDANIIFGTYGCGVKTCRDEVVYDFDKAKLAKRAERFVEDYNGEVDRYRRSNHKINIDEFVSYEKIKWSRDLKADLVRGRYAEFERQKIREAMYRPFCRKFLFFDRILDEEVYVFPKMLPKSDAETPNRIIALTDVGSEWPLVALAARSVVDMHFAGVGANSTQCFPYFVYDEDGTNRRENITDHALKAFRDHYKSKKLSKEDIFYYIYGVLHQPAYRQKYAANLRRDLPRIPFLGDFRLFVEAGQKLTSLHADYERLEPWPLTWICAKDKPLSLRVEKMRPIPAAESLSINDSLVLADILPESSRYRLGSRSALEWVVDQYQVTMGKRNGMKSDPNRADDPEYIVRLVGQVVRASVETVRIVDCLPAR